MVGARPLIKIFHVNKEIKKCAPSLLIHVLCNVKMTNLKCYNDACQCLLSYLQLPVLKYVYISIEMFTNSSNLFIIPVFVIICLNR